MICQENPQAGADCTIGQQPLRQPANQSPHRLSPESIDKYPQLTRERERELLSRAINAGDNNAKWQIIRGNYRYLFSLANSIDKHQADDLVQVGALEMFGAISRYDMSRNVRFSSFSSQGAYRAMMKFYKRHIHPQRQSNVDDPGQMLDDLQPLPKVNAGYEAEVFDAGKRDVDCRDRRSAWTQPNEVPTVIDSGIIESCLELRAMPRLKICFRCQRVDPTCPAIAAAKVLPQKRTLLRSRSWSGATRVGLSNFGQWDVSRTRVGR